MFFTAADSAAERELIRGSELRVLETLWGHVCLAPDLVRSICAAPYVGECA